MGQFSRQEVAERAGVDPDYVDRLVELGILRPGSGTTFSPGDVRRARWVQSFERAGVPLEGMATAVRDGALSFSYLDATAFDRFAGVSRTTFRDLSERTGVPMDLLLVVREAHGFAEPRPEDHVREDELALVPAMELLLSFGIRPEAIERLVRAYGDGLRRIVETETDWYRTEVELPFLEGGMTEVEMLAAQADLGSQITPFLDQALVSIYHGQQEHAWSKSAVEDVEGALERAGLYRRVHRPPAVSFLDISGYTRLTEERGDEAAAELATTLATLVRGSSREHGGQPVKWLGDGVMFYFPNPGDGVLAALDMVEGVAAHDLPPARVGIHAGPVVFQEGDYFGRTVNIASRIAEYARPGEVLVSQEVVDATDLDGLGVTAIGPIELKGVSQPLNLHSVRRLG
ncbi:MAG TPA: adenylate/guanylate cyclase domain-containing protein [Actinomycetota bacterium]